MASVLDDAGVPPGVVNVLPARRSGAVVSAMLHDPRVRKLSFTGSTEVGRVLLREAADQVINSSMELGGNAPFLVFADADLDAAIEGAMVAKMRNAGEACTAANRFYVEAPVAEEFAAGWPSGWARCGSVPGSTRPTRSDRSSTRRASPRSTSWCAAPWATGPGRWSAAPGRTGSASTSSRPCWSTYDRGRRSCPRRSSGRSRRSSPSTTEDEAVRLANDTEFGLVSYVYTTDLARGLRVSEALESGMVGLNRGLVSDPAAPFGGTKQSGIGREGGHDGMLDYLESKYIAVQW